MFKKDFKGNGKGGEENASNSINLIGAGTSIKGEIKTENDIRIDGTIQGNVITNSKIVLGEQAKVQGDVYCLSGDLSGYVEGNVYTKDVLHLKASSKINGDIHTKRLVVEKDAIFNGKCEMKEQVSFDQGKAGSDVQSTSSKSEKDDFVNQKDEKGKSQQSAKKQS